MVNKWCFLSVLDIEDLPRHLQSQLFEEILDADVEKGMYQRGTAW